MATFQEYPTPIVVQPIQNHLQSFIILHGRGANALNFGPPLLNTTLSDGKTFQQSFPNARFIFPTASFRRAEVFKRIRITQWFDLQSLVDPLKRSELQLDGLRETTAFLHGLIRKEADLIGSQNVVVGGLSQGCAAMLIGLLLWTDEPIRAAFGMSGWLPLYHLLDEKVGKHEMDEVDDWFEREEGVDANSLESGSEFQKAVRRLRDELDLPNAPVPIQLQTKIFLGHGVEDEKVDPKLGENATRVLEGSGCDVKWHPYADLGHWYSPKELEDIKDFIIKALDSEQPPDNRRGLRDIADRDVRTRE